MTIADSRSFVGATPVASTFCWSVFQSSLPAMLTFAELNSWITGSSSWPDKLRLGPMPRRITFFCSEPRMIKPPMSALSPG